MSRKRRNKHIIRGDGNRRRPTAPNSESWGMHEMPLTSVEALDAGDALLMLLVMIAKQVTVAGSIDRAIELGLIDVPADLMPNIRAAVPAFLGGEADGPDIREDWQQVVEQAEINTGCTCDELRAHLGL